MKELFMKTFGEWLKNKIHKIFNKKEDKKVNINVNGSNNNINVINGGKEIMDLIAKCKYCGKEFLDKDNFDFQEDCILHEAIGHLDLKEKFKTVTEKAIHMLNKKYNIQAYYEDIEINPDYNECCDCLRDELCGIKCTFHIYFDKNIKSYIGISIDFDSLENDLDINELIKNMEVDYKRYINDKLKPKKKNTHVYDFFQLKDEYGNMRLVFVDNNTNKKN